LNGRSNYKKILLKNAHDKSFHTGESLSRAFHLSIKKKLKTDEIEHD